MVPGFFIADREKNKRGGRIVFYPVGQRPQRISLCPQRLKAYFGMQAYHGEGGCPSWYNLAKVFLIVRSFFIAQTAKKIHAEGAEVLCSGSAWRKNIY